MVEDPIGGQARVSTLVVGLAVVGLPVGLAVDGALVGFAVGLAVEGAFVGYRIEVCRKSRIIMRYNFVHTSYIQEKSIILTLAVGLAVEGAFVGFAVGLAVEGALVGFIFLSRAITE